MPWRKGRRLPLVRESEANGETLQVYEQAKQILGVPYVSAMFRALAVYPKFLELFWQSVRPALETQQFFHLGDRLRAEAYTCVHNYLSLPELSAARDLPRETQQEIRETIEIFHYLDPLMLLLATTQMAAFERPVGQLPAGKTPAQHPIFVRPPLLAEEETASPEAKAIYEDMKPAFGSTALNTAYLALGRFPEFLENYWKVLKPITQSPLYTLSHAGVRETAWALVSEFPAPVELSSGRLSDIGLAAEEITAVARISELFVEGLSRRIVNVAVAKICVEGGNSQVETPPVPQGQGEPEQAA